MAEIKEIRCFKFSVMKLNNESVFIERKRNKKISLKTFSRENSNV